MKSVTSPSLKVASGFIKKPYQHFFLLVDFFFFFCQIKTQPRCTMVSSDIPWNIPQGAWFNSKYNSLQETISNPDHFMPSWKIQLRRFIAHCLMGRRSAIPLNIQCLSCILIGYISYGVHGIYKPVPKFPRIFQF